MNRNQISYEWVAEPLDEHGDIIDPLFSDTLEGAIAQAGSYDNVVYALVLNIGNDINGLRDRDYAHLNAAGDLPGYFPELDRKIPARFHLEAQEAKQ